MKEAQRNNTKDDPLQSTVKNATGETVSFVTTANSGCEIAEVYLKHPGNESSEDEDGTENRQKEEDEEKEDFFRDLIKRRNIKQNERENKLQAKPSTSKN